MTRCMRPRRFVALVGTLAKERKRETLFLCSARGSIHSTHTNSHQPPDHFVFEKIMLGEANSPLPLPFMAGLCAP